ncbi:unnamed protein product [Effrenium voratum]|uniref:Uncharacterized protein n=1 Tax=Effrenium voratum TaxID=2562239 RepID=A0AA36MRS8_9DINO|nr:unnamed protein product [Effrenium voratum]
MHAASTRRLELAVGCRTPQLGPVGRAGEGEAAKDKFTPPSQLSWIRLGQLMHRMVHVASMASQRAIAPCELIPEQLRPMGRQAANECSMWNWCGILLKVIVLGEIFARALLIERVRAQAAGCISFRTCAGLSKLRLRF